MSPQQEKELQIILSKAHMEYEKGLKARAFFKVSNHALSDDLVQNTFLKTWLYLKKGGKIDMMKAFLYHVLNNLIIDEYRKHKTTSLNALLEKGFDPDSGEAGRLEDVLDGEIAVGLIPSLPEKYQQVMTMKYMQDLSLEEISEATGQSKNTITVQAHRGLKKLKLLYSHS